MIRARGQGAFTLVEIMVVLVIIGLLGSFLFGRIFSSGEVAKARMTELRANALKQKVSEYRLMYNALPAQIEDLTRCTDVTGPGCIPLLEQNDDGLNDAWGRPFQYTRDPNGRTFTIMSFGADGAPGGEGVDYDITVTGP